jgi:hypothetical protein
MAFVFLSTGIWGAMFAMSFAKTKSLYLPIGLHFGWNFISTVIFSRGPLGDQLLTISGAEKLGGALSAVAFIFQLFSVPAITFWYLNFQSKKKRSSTDIKSFSERSDLVDQQYLLLKSDK